MSKSPRKLLFRFTSSLERLDRDPPFPILPVPDEVAAAWQQAKIRRLIGTINGYTIKRALMNHADGGSFLIVSRDIIKAAKIGARTPAAMEFGPDPEPDKVDMPEEFRLILADDPAARTRWETFTLGRRRSLASYVASAKTEPTRIKRSLELALKIRTHTLYGDSPKGAPNAHSTRSVD